MYSELEFFVTASLSSIIYVCLKLMQRIQAFHQDLGSECGLLGKCRSPGTSNATELLSNAGHLPCLLCVPVMSYFLVARTNECASNTPSSPSRHMY